MDFPLLILFAVVPVFLIGQIYFLGRKMSEPEKMIRPLPGGLTPFQHQTLVQYRDWLASVGLEYRNAFQFGAITAVVFQQGDKPRFFSFFFHQKLSFNAESYLDDLTVLDTGTGAGGGLFPRPGAYGQSFPNISPQEVWQRHLDGEAFLSQKFGYVWPPLKKPYEQILPEAMRVRMKHNRAQLFWPVRVLYRYFVTQHRLKNRPIAQQFR